MGYVSFREGKREISPSLKQLSNVQESLLAPPKKKIYIFFGVGDRKIMCFVHTKQTKTHDCPHLLHISCHPSIIYHLFKEKLPAKKNFGRKKILRGDFPRKGLQFNNTPPPSLNRNPSGLEMLAKVLSSTLVASSDGLPG